MKKIYLRRGLNINREGKKKEFSTDSHIRLQFSDFLQRGCLWSGENACGFQSFTDRIHFTFSHILS